MRLLFTISSLESGGAERVLTSLANHFATNTMNEIHIIILRPLGTSSFYPLDPRIILHPVGSFKSPQSFFLLSILHKLKVMWRMRTVIHRIGPDRIISFIELMNIVIMLATRGVGFREKKPKIILCERTDPFQFKIPFVLDQLRHLLYPLAHKIVLQRDSVKSYFSKGVQQKCLTIPNAIPPFHLDNPPPQENVILSIGRMDQGKDHITLLKAFAKLAPDYPEWSLEIYGDGVLRPDLENFIKAHQLDTRIRLPGKTQDVPHQLARARIFAFPTLYEGFSNALGEAMAAGQPVVASNCAGNQALVEDGLTGILFPLKDVGALERALRDLMDHPEKRKSLGNAAQGRMKDFHPDRVMALWDEMIADARSSS